MERPARVAGPDSRSLRPKSGPALPRAVDPNAAALAESGRMYCVAYTFPRSLQFVRAFEGSNPGCARRRPRRRAGRRTRRASVTRSVTGFLLTACQRQFELHAAASYPRVAHSVSEQAYPRRAIGADLDRAPHRGESNQRTSCLRFLNHGRGAMRESFSSAPRRGRKSRPRRGSDFYASRRK